MKILLIGYGKMGKFIEQIALQRGHEIVGRISSSSPDKLEQFNGQNTDVAIEFTQPEAAFNHVAYCAKNNIAVVCGTTGWQAHRAEAEAIVNQHNGAFFQASNFSIGVNLFFHLNKLAAQVFEKYPVYDVSMAEIHHTEKKDAPSGTAITLAEGILQNFSRKTQWTLNESEQNTDLVIKALREPHVPGTHTINYTSAIDTITLTHTAHSREGFATGAVFAAEWLKGRKGVFGMAEMLGF